MPWYFYSLIALVLYPIYSLSQKWALNLKINKTILLTDIFVGLFLCYFAYNLLDIPVFFQIIKSREFYLWGILVAILSMAGNTFSVKAIEKSPNPGYVQAVESTNSLVVLFASLMIFNASVTWLKLIGIIIIIIGLYLLLVTKGNQKSNHWQLFAIVSMLCYGSMYLAVKQMSNLGIESRQILMILFFLATIGFIGKAYKEKIGFGVGQVSKIVILPVIMGILVAFVTNLFNFMAIRLVSNPGYSTAVLNSAVVLTLILSPFVFPRDFGGEFNAKKWLGVIVTIAGVLFVILG